MTNKGDYNPKNPDAFNQFELPPPLPPALNIIPLGEGNSTIDHGSFQSKNFVSGKSGFKISENGTIEAMIILSPIRSYTPAINGTVSLDVTISNDHRIQMPAGNITITIGKVLVGQKFLVSITQDSVGSKTVTWFNTIRWVDGAAPVLSTSANKRDTFGFICTGPGTFDGFILGLFI